MREVLKPIIAHNPTVEAQRPGFCVVNPVADVFACDPDDATCGFVMGHGWRYGWCGPRGKVKVWTDKGAAEYVAARLKGTVVTVPRCNGYCVEWERVEATSTTTIVIGDALPWESPRAAAARVREETHARAAEAWARCVESLGKWAEAAKAAWRKP